MLRCAAKQHMLNEMGDSFLSVRIVTSPRLDVESDFDAMKMGHFDRHDAQAIGKGLNFSGKHQTSGLIFQGLYSRQRIPGFKTLDKKHRQAVVGEIVAHLLREGEQVSFPVRPGWCRPSSPILAHNGVLRQWW